MALILEKQDRNPNEVGKSKVVGESWIKGKGCGRKRIEAEGLKPCVAEWESFW